MSLLSKYCPRTEFSSYEDFYENFHIVVPEHFNFSFDVLDYYADKEPERLALVWCDDHGGEEFIHFGELRDRVNRTANLLREHGVGKGDHVMLLLKSRHEFWNVMLALHKLGAVAVPATHTLTNKDLTYRIQLGSIKACICYDNASLLDEVDEAQRATGDILKLKISVAGRREGWVSYEEALANSSPVFPTPPKTEWPSNHDIMLLYFTSGTSGLPKMVQRDFAYPLAHIITAGFWQNVQEGGLHFTVAETGWMKAVWGKLYGQWLCGSAIFVYDHEYFNAPNMMSKIAKYKVTSFCAPPTVYRFLIKEDFTKYDFSSVKYCVTAGEPMNTAVYERFEALSGLKLHEAFGQSETVVTTAIWPWMEPRPGSIGKPTPGYRLELLDAQGEPVADGEEGEICIRVDGELPPGIFGGYYLDPERTASVRHDGFYHTGDVAKRDADGFLWYVGRNDDVIKSSGYRIGPYEVESVLMMHPAILECAVTGVPDPRRGQLVKATVVLANGFEPSDVLKEELQHFVQKQTAPYKYPRVIVFVDSLPKTISGKIMRGEIQKQDEQVK